MVHWDYILYYLSFTAYLTAYIQCTVLFMVNVANMDTLYFVLLVVQKIVRIIMCGCISINRSCIITKTCGGNC